MIYVLRFVEDGVEKAKKITLQEARDRNWEGVQEGRSWTNRNTADRIAQLLTEHEGHLFIAVQSSSTDFDIIEAPVVGDKVSYAINGDCTPCGVITKISASMRVITTSTGKKFYRRGESGAWYNCKYFGLVSGHIYERNPHI